ncbi:MAG: hypothetical protein JKX69_01360 [Rhodobacteraceae bacterium]|nr:hypothetical protein [Paracoccaceae bacterium]PHR53567.1 MAG: hypothetical protein COA47_16780 [Robiginitomaculum sp.]
MPVMTKISTLWIVVLFNMIFADVLSYMYPGFLAEITTGIVEGVTITPMLLIVAAIFVEIAILMIYLSRVLSQSTNRIVNLVAVVITLAFVIGGGSLKPHYIFFASFEVIALLYIGYLSWKWREDAALTPR